MNRLLTAAGVGALFGLGLLVSGMTDPGKVQGWLDVFGNWDPTLGFVLGGAIIPMAIAWRIAARRRTALTGVDFPPPPPTRIDGWLIGGSALFGIGWGLSGLCPAPALAGLLYSGAAFAVFVAAMASGFLVARLIPR